MPRKSKERIALKARAQEPQDTITAYNNNSDEMVAKVNTVRDELRFVNQMLGVKGGE